MSITTDSLRSLGFERRNPANFVTNKNVADLIVNDLKLLVNEINSIVGSDVTGVGTTSFVPKWTDGAGSVIGDSIIYNHANGIRLGSLLAYPSALLAIDSTTQGVLHPRMTTAQRNAIGSPVEGLWIYNTTTSLFNYYDGVTWQTVDSSTTADTLAQVLASGRNVDATGTIKDFTSVDAIDVNTRQILDLVGDFSFDAAQRNLNKDNVTVALDWGFLQLLGNWTIDGNFAPLTNNVYALGDATHGWSTLFMSSTTNPAIEYAQALVFNGAGVERMRLTTGGSLGIGTAPVASSVLDISSTTQGMLVPRMTTAQKNAIAAPATGLLVFDTTLGLFSYYTGAVWTSLDSGTNDWTQGGNAYGALGTFGTTDAFDVAFITSNTEKMRLTTGGNLGIGVTPTTTRLHVVGSTNTSATASLRAENSDLVVKFQVLDNGSVGINNTADSTKGLMVRGQSTGIIRIVDSGATEVLNLYDTGFLAAESQARWILGDSTASSTSRLALKGISNTSTNAGLAIYNNAATFYTLISRDDNRLALGAWATGTPFASMSISANVHILGSVATDPFRVDTATLSNAFVMNSSAEIGISGVPIAGRTIHIYSGSTTANLSSSTSVADYGILSDNMKVGGYGIEGRGNTVGGRGVSGTSTTGFGGFFTASSGVGMFASATTGVGSDHLSETGIVARFTHDDITLGASSSNPTISIIRETVLNGFDMTGALLSINSTVADTGHLIHVQKQATDALILSSNKNLGLLTGTFGTSAVGVLGIFNGTPPSTSPADTFQMYSKDWSGAGTATLHARNEEGHIFIYKKSAAYTPTNVTTDRSFDANSLTLDELADVVGTLVADLQGNGLLG